MSGWVLKDGDDGHAFIMPEETLIDSHDFLVVCRNREKFTNLFPSVKTVNGEMDFGFSSKGECVRLFTSSGMLMDRVCYENDDPWPSEPNGGGATLALFNTLGNNERPDTWRASFNHGTPGMKNIDIITALNDLTDETISPDEIVIYPNPAKRFITISVQSLQKEEVSFALSDVTGKKGDKMLRFSLSQGKNELDLDLTYFQKTIHPGVYILHVTSNSFSRRLKVLVY